VSFLIGGDYVSEKFERAFQEVLNYEGGYSNHEADRGGATKFGITEEVARQAGYEGDMQDLSLEKAKEIYRENYWEYEDLPVEIGIECFDQAVNMGNFTANKHLQMAVNCFREDEIAIDGIMGSNTAAAVNSCKYIDELVKVINILQGERYVKIALNDPSQKIFIRGWIKRVAINKN
jgi:lysozyme family protein